MDQQYGQDNHTIPANYFRKSTRMRHIFHFYPVALMYLRFQNSRFFATFMFFHRILLGFYEYNDVYL